jgi:uncharacterized protein (DUF58 family)
MRDIAKKPNKPYIIPTIYGVAYLFLIVNIFAMSYYRDSAPFHTVGLTLIVLGLVAMIQTNANIQPVDIELFGSEPGPAQGTIPLTLVLRNRQDVPLYNLTLQLEKPFSSKDEFLIEELAGSTTVTFIVPCGERGIFPIKRIRVSSIGYYGLFRAWKWSKLETELTVYPQPKGSLPLPMNSESGDSQRRDRGDDFIGHRPFTPGHSLKQIDWKAHARGQPLLIKDFADHGDGPLHLRWMDVPGHDPEIRLEQMAAWIMASLVMNRPFSLEMPQKTIAEAAGQDHLLQALRALACHKEG